MSRGLPRALLRGAVWGVLIAVIATVILLTLFHRRGTEVPPPAIKAVPDFALTNRDGRTVTRGDLLGAPWVADFIFTRCAGPCPLMSRNFKDLGPRLPEGVRRVSFSVDPTHDTPQVLQAYAERYDAPADWLFLTGDYDEVQHLAIDGFLLGVYPADDPLAAEAAGGNEHGPILHSTRSVLVDAEGTIRGYYDLFEAGAADELVAAVEALAAER